MCKKKMFKHKKRKLSNRRSKIGLKINFKMRKSTQKKNLDCKKNILVNKIKFKEKIQ